MKDIKDESDSTAVSIKPVTERLIQLASIAVLVYVVWTVSANTVVSLVKKNMEISNLQRQVQILQQVNRGGKR